MSISKIPMAITSAISILVMAIVGPSQPVSAQASVDDVLPGGAMCMVRPIADGGEQFWILVPAKDVRGMTANGFLPGPCNAAFDTAAKREAYRDAICQIASSWREELQYHFEVTRGERPAVLCGMAELAIGQWKRGGRR